MTEISAAAIRALDWVGEHLAHFEPTRGGQSPTEMELQALAELALVVRLWIRRDVKPVPPSIHVLRLFLTTLAGDAQLWHRGIRRPDEFVPLCDLIAATRRSDTPLQRKALQQVVESGALHGVDRTIVSELELRLTIEWAGLRGDFSGLDDITSRCQRPRLPMYTSDHDCYALTHLVIFATDFGYLPPPISGGLSERTNLSRVLSSLIVRYTSERNLDLLIELLLSWHYLRLPHTKLIQQAWRVFVTNQSADGSFSSRVNDREENQGQPAAVSRDKAWFLQRYHTTLLAIIASTSPLPKSHPERVSADHIDCGDKLSKNVRAAWEDLVLPARRIGEAACHWTVDTAFASNGQNNRKTFAYAVFAWWILRALWDKSSAYQEELSESLRCASRELTFGDYFPTGANSLTLNIMAAGIIRRFGVDNGAATRFLKHISDIVKRNKREDQSEGLAFCEKEVLLNVLGFNHDPYRCGYGVVVFAAERCAYFLDSVHVNGLLDSIESLTGFGTHYVRVEPIDIWLQDLLQGIADDALRKYHWRLACRCVRSLRYLGLVSPERAREYMAFLGLHQLADGSFGYFGPDLEELLKGSAACISATELYTATTVEALWTVAELGSSHRWTLYESLREATDYGTKVALS